MIFDFNTLSILCHLSLDTYYITSKNSDSWIYIITELEIFQINIMTFSTHRILALPDIYEDSEFENHHLKVRCMDGTFILIPE